MLEGFASLVGVISNVMYSYLLIIMLLAVGLYFTLRSRFVQLRLLPESIRVVGEKTDSNSVSAFQALMVSTASRVGTGNIVGVANAIAIGGYGAVFWMWLIAIVGGASAFIESTLAQIYKKRDASGGSYGGPSYYIEAALKNRALGVIFAIALIATYAGGFNMLASFNLIDSMSNYGFYHQFMMGDKSLVPMIGGAILAILVGMFQGGIQALSRSYYGKIIPKDHANEYYGFYDIFGKTASIIGTFLVATTTSLTGNASIGVLSIAILLAVALVFLLLQKDPTKGSTEAATVD